MEMVFIKILLSIIGLALFLATLVPLLAINTLYKADHKKVDYEWIFYLFTIIVMVALNVFMHLVLWT